MSDNSNPSLHELYDAASKIIDLVEIMRSINFATTPASIALPALAEFLGKLATLLVDLDWKLNLACESSLEQQIIASRQNESVTFFGEHPNALRAVLSLANSVRFAAAGGRVPVVSENDLDDRAAMGKAYLDGFLAQGNIGHNPRKWIAHCKRFMATLLPMDWNRTRTILPLEKAAAASFLKERQTDIAPPPALSRPGKLILGAILKYYPTLQTIEEICGTLGGEWSERTVGPELKALTEAGLAVRPHGKGKGATLTPAGKTLAEKLSSR